MASANKKNRRTRVRPAVVKFVVAFKPVGIPPLLCRLLLALEIPAAYRLNTLLSVQTFVGEVGRVSPQT